MTQAELADRSGLSQITINRLEAGAHWPTYANLEILAKNLEIVPENLFAGLEEIKTDDEILQAVKIEPTDDEILQAVKYALSLRPKKHLEEELKKAAKETEEIFAPNKSRPKKL